VGSAPDPNNQLENLVEKKIYYLLLLTPIFLGTSPVGLGPLSFTNPIIEDDTDGKTDGNLGVLRDAWVGV
jgi:hypothetical protein